jgi:hypothetical protein
LFSVEFFQPRPGIGQAKPMPFTGRQRTLRVIVFYLDAKQPFDGRSSDSDLASIRATRDAMPDGILNNRLQEKPGNLGLVGF